MFKQQFIKIYTFLSEYKSIAQKEVLNHYPQCIDDYPSDWEGYLSRSNDRTLWMIDSLESIPKDVLQKEIGEAPSQFIGFLDRIQTISYLPKKEKIKFKQLPSWAWQKVKHKKRHEIEVILSHFYSHENLIDLCGGQGHTSRINAHYLQKKSIVIDHNSNLINLGQRRKIKFPIPDGAKKIDFITGDLNHLDKIEQLISPYLDNSLLLGLHTCGNLALKFFELNQKLKTSFLNFGCCYNKLTPKNDTLLSNTAKQYPFVFTNHSLTLATRSNFGGSYDDFLLKKRVKYYRYALFLYLRNEHGITNFLGVGSSPINLYRGNFSDYARINLLNLNISTNDNLDIYFNQNHIQRELKKLLSYTLIRWQLSRPIEVYLLLDRYFYLQENNINVQIAEYFDPKLSPRNIGISYVNEYM